MNPIRAVVLDYGNVLCRRPKPDEFETLYRLSGIAPQRFQECFWRYRRDYDRGTLEGPAYWRKVAEDASVILTDEQIAQLIGADVELWQERDPVMWRWVETLRTNGLKTAVLSNMPREVANSLRRAPSWLEGFDCVVLSSDFGSLKPEPKIYQICLDKLQVRAEEALFIDDHAENVEGARALGMYAVQFESPTQLAAALAPFHLPTLQLAAS